MCTLILTWINARYKHEYEALFMVTIFMDLAPLLVFCDMIELLCK